MEKPAELSENRGSVELVKAQNTESAHHREIYPDVFCERMTMTMMMTMTMTMTFGWRTESKVRLRCCRVGEVDECSRIIYHTQDARSSNVLGLDQIELKQPKRLCTFIRSSSLLYRHIHPLSHRSVNRHLLLNLRPLPLRLIDNRTSFIPHKV